MCDERIEYDSKAQLARAKRVGDFDAYVIDEQEKEEMSEAAQKKVLDWWKNNRERIIKQTEEKRK